MGLGSRGISRRSCAAIATAVVLAGPAYAQPLKGDWPMLNFDARGQRYNPYETALGTKTVKSLQPAWKVDIGDTHSSPAVVGGVVYAGSDDGHLHALDAATGTPIWSVRLGSRINSSPAVNDGIVFVVNTDGKFYALDAASGAKLWTAKLDSPVSGSPTASKGRVYIAGDSGTLYAFDARSGVKSWNTDRWAAAAPNAPAVANGVVYSLSSIGHVLAYDAAAGTKLWDADFDNSIYGYGSPAVEDGKVYASSGRIVGAFDAVTGTEDWSSAIGPNQDGSIALAHHHLYAATEDRVIWNYDTKTIHLKASDGQAYLKSAPTIANGVLYAVTYDKTVNAYGAATGKLLWSAPMDAVPQTSPVVTNGRVYVAAGSLYAYGLKD